MRRSNELSVASGSIARAINSSLLLTSNRRISWKQFGLGIIGFQSTSNLNLV
jgi:hypothetical protein